MATVRDGETGVARIPVAVLTTPPQYPPQAARPSRLDRAQAEDLEALADVVGGGAGGTRRCSTCSARRTSPAGAGSTASTTTRC